MSPVKLYLYRFYGVNSLALIDGETQFIGISPSSMDSPHHTLLHLVIGDLHLHL